MKQEHVDQLSQSVKQSQIIYASLVMGVLFFAGITVFLVGQKFNTDLGMMTILGIAMAFPLAAASFIVPEVMKRGLAGQAASELGGKHNADKKSADDQEIIMLCAKHYQVTRIIRAAILEGGAFLNLVFFMLEGSAFSLAAGFALLCIMAMGFPTTSRAVNWLDSPIGSHTYECEVKLGWKVFVGL